MKEYLRLNYQYLILCSLWIAAGVIAGSLVASIFILLSLLLLKSKNLYQEMFLGFLLILILSDSRDQNLSFAIDVKVIYIILLSVFLLFNRKSFTSHNKFIFLFWPFLILALFLVVISENVQMSFQKCLSYSLLMLVVPNYVEEIYKEHGNIFFKNIIFLFSIVLLLGLVFTFIFPSMTYLAGRYRGLFGNPNGIGLFCTLFFLLYSVVKEYFPEIFSRSESIYIYVVIILSAILCGSRNTLMSMFCFMMFSRLYKISPYMGFLILCAVGVGYELLLQNLELFLRSFGLADYFRIETLETGSGRNVAWTFTWRHIMENFFFGNGFAYDELLFEKNTENLSILGHQGNVHNSFLTFWLNTGIIGLLLFLRGFFLAFFQASKNSRIATPVMFTILFSATFESWMSASLNPITIQLWIILTILTSPKFNEDKSPLPVY